MSDQTQAAEPDSLDVGEYIARRVRDQIDWYDRKSIWNQRWFKRLRLVEILAAALIPFLTAGVLITVVAGVLALHQFQERWTEYRTTCESLKKELFLFLTRAEPYAAGEAFSMLVQKVETLISKENTNWAQSLARPERKKELEA
jgi:hypothetical protein